jgi:hypothetical protein
VHLASWVSTAPNWLLTLVIRHLLQGYLPFVRLVPAKSSLTFVSWIDFDSSDLAQSALKSFHRSVWLGSFPYILQLESCNCEDHWARYTWDPELIKFIHCKGDTDVHELVNLRGEKVRTQSKRSCACNREKLNLALIASKEDTSRSLFLLFVLSKTLTISTDDLVVRASRIDEVWGLPKMLELLYACQTQWTLHPCSQWWSSPKVAAILNYSSSLKESFPVFQSRLCSQSYCFLNPTFTKYFFPDREAYLDSIEINRFSLCIVCVMGPFSSISSLLFSSESCLIITKGYPPRKLLDLPGLSSALELSNNGVTILVW